MKAVIATDVIFIVVVIGLIVGASLIVFWKWTTYETEANEVTCQLKLRSYCIDLLRGRDPNWNELHPKYGCEDYNVNEPDEEGCKKIA